MNQQRSLKSRSERTAMLDAIRTDFGKLPEGWTVGTALIAALEPAEDEVNEAREALAELHQWAKAYDWYYCDGDVDGELLPLRERIEGILR